MLWSEQLEMFYCVQLRTSTKTGLNREKNITKTPKK